MDDILKSTNDPEVIAQQLADLCAKSGVLNEGIPDGTVFAKKVYMPQGVQDFTPYTVHTVKYRTPSQALASAKGKQYKDAQTIEYTALLTTGTLGFRARKDLPQGTNIMGHLEITTEKADENNIFVSCKWRVVAKGQTQQPNKDFDPAKTYAPVADYGSMKLVTAIGTKYDLDIEGLDFHTAYLQSEVKEDVYTHLLPGYVAFLQETAGDTDEIKGLKQSSLKEYHVALDRAQGDPKGVVHKLQSALPGMRQSARCWNDKLHAYLVQQGFKRLHQDAGVYFRMKDGSPQILLLFVDDVMLVAKSPGLVAIKEHIKKNFKVKLLGELRHFCGMRVRRNRDEGWLKLDQEAYVMELVKQYQQYLPNHTTCPTTPMLARSTLVEASEDDQKAVSKLPYQNLVMALLFLARVTRLDISFSVSQLCRFMQAPGIQHWNAAVRVLHYLQGSSGAGITYSQKAVFGGLITFVDAEFGSADVATMRSVFGFLVFYAGGPVNLCVKQHVRAVGNTGATEYMALKTAADATKSDRLKLEGLGFQHEVNDPTTIICDNKLAVALANLECNSSRTKSIDNIYHVVRDYVQLGEIAVKYGSTVSMLADCCTKPLGPVRFGYLMEASMAGPDKSAFDTIIDSII